VSRLLAQRLHYHYLDTGAMYRAVGLAVLRSGVSLDNKKEITRICNSLEIKVLHEGDATKIYLDNEDVTKAIREPVIDLIASDVSTLDNVRKVMTILQRKMGSQGPLVAEVETWEQLYFQKPGTNSILMHH